jgi:hypothetical protein
VLFTERKVVKGSQVEVEGVRKELSSPTTKERPSDPSVVQLKTSQCERRTPAHEREENISIPEAAIIPGVCSCFLLLTCEEVSFEDNTPHFCKTRYDPQRELFSEPLRNGE